MFKRILYPALLRRLQEGRGHIQVLIGPRQVGKTTLSKQIAEYLQCPTHYVSADDPSLKGRDWIEQQWNVARLRATNSEQGALLILDEIQKISDWSEVVKSLWDADTFNNHNIRVLILGSSALLLQKGLSESLAGRFEVTPVMHWSYLECQACFGWNVEQFIYYGGYPGSAQLIADENRWKSYVRESLIETSIAKDIFLLTRIHKPAVLRNLFELGSLYSGQVLSYQKMLGQLQDAGNATTVAHYLELLANAGLITGLSKYANQPFRKKASSPKLQVFNNALITSQQPLTYEQFRNDPEKWGHLVESAVGAHLVNSAQGSGIKVHYWRDGNEEVDFVLTNGEKTIAIEVKSGHKNFTLPGMEKFGKLFKPYKKLLVGGQGIRIDEFLSAPIQYWFT